MFDVPNCRIGSTCARTCCRCTYAVYAETSEREHADEGRHRRFISSDAALAHRVIVVQKKRAAHR